VLVLVDDRQEPLLEVDDEQQRALGVDQHGAPPPRAAGSFMS
jgi:hypothetical protein